MMREANIHVLLRFYTHHMYMYMYMYDTCIVYVHVSMPKKESSLQCSDGNMQHGCSECNLSKKVQV